MKINGLTPVYFDIETTGFSAWEDDFVCAAGNREQYNPWIGTSLGRLMLNIEETHRQETIILVTYNGENYRGGFDFPWLRSKCIQEGIEWKLAGVNHLDLLPLVRKYINTTRYTAPSKSNLYADDLKKLAEANDIEYSNKSQCYEALEQLDNVDWLDYEQEAKEDNSLQAVYQMMFDPKKEEEYIDGGRIPILYEAIQFGYMQDKDKAWQEIKDHNRRDVERLKKIAEKVIPVIPDWEIERNINKL